MKIRIKGVLIALAVLFTSIQFPLDAEAGYDGSAILEIFSTTDLHGQSIRYSYDSASDHIGSLAQISSVIEDEKENIEYGTSLLVDSGDVVFGRAAENIGSGDFSGIQYMYKIMKRMGYDAITLGNHDFDYGYSYIKNALEASGLSDKVVLSNVVNAKSKKNIYARSRIIEKTLRTSKGKKKTIRIGVTGAVTPNLGTFSDLTGEVETQDIITCVKSEVKKLKEKKADVIIVLSHSGLGKMKSPKKMQEHVSYHLAKIPGVDVVCAGHSHQDYPSTTSSNAKVLSYDDVDEETGMVDDTILIEEEDHGESLGISKLALYFYPDGVDVEPRSAKVRKMKNTDDEDERVVTWNNEYDKKYRQMYDASLAKTGGVTDNYFGTIEDNALVQLANEAKIAYGLKKVEELAPEYASYPIIASTHYKNAGKVSGSDYIASDGDITYAVLLKLQAYGQKYARAHYLTGAQLRECLEWCAASAYQQPVMAVMNSWKDPIVNKIVEYGCVKDEPEEESPEEPIPDDGITEPEYPAEETYQQAIKGDQAGNEKAIAPILSTDWEDWTGYTVFDGVEYTIDPSQPARYDKAGNLIDANARRVTSITVDGKYLSDSDKVVLISNTVQPEDGILPSLKKAVTDQLVFGKTEHLTNIVYEYLATQSMADEVPVREDSNWKVKFDPNYRYLIKTSADTFDKVAGRKWQSELAYIDTEYAYYLADFDEKNEDNSAPFLVATKMTDEIQGEPIEIRVQASDPSGIASLSYARGVYTYESNWNPRGTITGGKFYADYNDIYTVRAVDNNGNVSLRYVAVTNLNSSSANTPKIDPVTNLDTKISGSASADATVYINVNGQTFTAETGADGRYECEVGRLSAEDTVKVWQVDSKRRTSVEVETTVARAAANYPTVNDLDNKTTKVTGRLEDSKFCRILAVRGDTIYAPKGQKSIVKKSAAYKKGMTIEEVKYSFNTDTKRFALVVPKIYADQEMEIYSYDWLGRSSEGITKVVEDVAPNMPILKKIVSQEGMVYGRIPQIKEGVEYTVTVKCSGGSYTGTADEKGSFVIDANSMHNGTKVTITASDEVEGVTRDSLSKSGTAVTFADIGTDNFVNSQIDTIDSKDVEISGQVRKNHGTTVFLMIGGARYELELDEEGRFVFDLEEPLSEDTKVGLISRNLDGSFNTFRYTSVKLAKPDAPEFVTETVDENTKTIVIKCVDKADAYLKIGGRIFTPSKIKTRPAYYVYVFKVKDLKPKKHISAYMKNKSGSSEIVKNGKVKKVKKPKKDKDKEKKE